MACMVRARARTGNGVRRCPGRDARTLGVAARRAPAGACRAAAGATSSRAGADFVAPSPREPTTITAASRRSASAAMLSPTATRSRTGTASAWRPGSRASAAPDSATDAACPRWTAVDVRDLVRRWGPRTAPRWCRPRSRRPWPGRAPRRWPPAADGRANSATASRSAASAGAEPSNATITGRASCGMWTGDHIRAPAARRPAPVRGGAATSGRAVGPLPGTPVRRVARRLRARDAGRMTQIAGAIALVPPQSAGAS